MVDVVVLHGVTDALLPPRIVDWSADSRGDAVVAAIGDLAVFDDAVRHERIVNTDAGKEHPPDVGHLAVANTDVIRTDIIQRLIECADDKAIAADVVDGNAVQLAIGIHPLKVETIGRAVLYPAEVGEVDPR